MNRTLGAIAIACLLILTGCTTGTPLSVSYHPKGPLAGAKKRVTLLVAVPDENRPDGKEGSDGSGFLALIPGIPCGQQRFTPERKFKAYRIDYDFRKDLGATVAADLQAAGIAAQVIYQDGAQTPQTGGGANACYTLHLKLNDSTWHRWVWTYGTSVFASMIWIYGIPVSYGSFDLVFDATLQDSHGAIIGSQTFKGHRPLTEIIWDTDKILRTMPATYGDISPQLRQFIAQNLDKSVAAK